MDGALQDCLVGEVAAALARLPMEVVPGFTEPGTPTAYRGQIRRERRNLSLPPLLWGWRLSWKKMKRLIQETYAFAVRGL